MAEGGDLCGILALDWKMLPVVAARLIDCAWKGSGIEKDLEDRFSEDAVVVGVDEKAEGDIGGLALVDIGPHCMGVTTFGEESERSFGWVDSITDIEH